jgi:type 1 glutamine amidotransferase
MKLRVALLALVAAALFVPVAAQQPVPAAPASALGQVVPAAQVAPIRVFLRAGLKSHGEGLHDYPQFLGDWSKILTDHGAIVDGGLHFPNAQELAGVDVIVMYKGDAGYMTASEKAVLEDYIKRGGGIVTIHDTLCGDDPEYFATVVGGGKKHGETNFDSSGPIKYTVVDKANPIMQGFPDDVALTDEAFFKMTWAKAPNEIHVLATAAMPRSGEVVPQIWTYEHTMFGGQPARSFVWMQGHTYTNLTHAAIEPMLLRGIAWVAKRPYDAILNVRPQPQRGGGGAGGRQGGGRAGAPGTPGAPGAPAAPAGGAGGRGAGRGGN